MFNDRVGQAYGGGGGGYGCGSAQVAHNSAGGGGGGGGYGAVGTNGSHIGGNGGYSIYNQGTIITLSNGQGGQSQIITGGTTYFPYGPLFYGTTNSNGLTNYKIIINSATSYGQLWNTGWGTLTPGIGGTGPSGELIVNFDIDTTYPFLQTTYYQVLVNVKPTSLTYAGIINSHLGWYLKTGTPVTIGKYYGSVTYNSYDLVIDNTAYLGIDNLIYFSTYGTTISTTNISFNAFTNSFCLNPTPYSGYPGNSVYTIDASINSFTNTYSLLGGGGGRGPASGDPSGDGGHGLVINTNCIVTTVINKGALLGGGGGTFNYSGGAGGGGAGTDGAAGSIVQDIVAGSGTLDGSGSELGTVQGTGGGGPSGNGGSLIDASGGLGGGTYASTNYGSPGGNAQGGNAGTNSYNFTYGGGAGIGSYGGGGGYGCGSGGAPGGNAFGGGGGGGGGYNSGRPFYRSGAGGYSIYNQGTIQTLSNAQGGPTNQIITGGGSPFPYGPLFYGTTPTNTSGLTDYKIIINSATSYGQLWNTGWGTLTLGPETGPSGELLINSFDIDYDNSTIPFGRTTTITTFYQVLVNVIPTNPISRSGTSSNGKITWILTRNSNTYVTIGKYDETVSYNYYDLVITNNNLLSISNGFLFNTFFL